MTVRMTEIQNTASPTQEVEKASTLQRWTCVCPNDYTAIIM